MRRTFPILAIAILAGILAGCSTGHIGQAQKGREFDRTGGMVGWAGGHGFKGPILPPGSYWTGIYDEIRIVDCSARTVREPMESLTKDGVQFNMDMYIRFNADCNDDKVGELLEMLNPDQEHTISNELVYSTFIRPALGEAVRKAISPMDANDINASREEILTQIRSEFLRMMEEQEPSFVRVSEVNLSNLHFPTAMTEANTERAVQGIMRDMAVAARERVEAETQTEQMRIALARTEGQREAARIDEIGAALKRNPDYLQYMLQSMMPQIYLDAGANGNLVLTAPNPSVLVSSSGRTTSHSTSPTASP